MLRVKATGQALRRLDTIGVVSDSINYLYAHFDLPSDYKGVITAHFKVDVNGVASDAPITLDAQHNCLVPSNVIRAPGFSIAVSSLDNGIYIVTDELNIDVASCGVPSELLPAPGETTNQYAELAAAVSTSTASASSASTSAASALASANSANASASALGTVIDTVNVATANANTATANANTATDRANVAAQAAEHVVAGTGIVLISDLVDTDTINDTEKAPSSAVTCKHGVDIRANATAITGIGENLSANLFSKKSTVDLTALSTNNVYKVDFSCGDEFNFVLYRNISEDGSTYGSMHLKVVGREANWGNYSPFYDIIYSYGYVKNLKKIVGNGNSITFSLYLRGGRTYHTLEYNKLYSIVVNSGTYETYVESECMNQGFYKGFATPNITVSTTPHAI